MTEEEIETIIDSIYFKEKGVISFTEFEAAMLDRSFYTDRRRLETLF